MYASRMPFKAGRCISCQLWCATRGRIYSANRFKRSMFGWLDSDNGYWTRKRNDAKNLPSKWCHFKLLFASIFWTGFMDHSVRLLWNKSAFEWVCLIFNSTFDIQTNSLVMHTFPRISKIERDRELALKMDTYLVHSFNNYVKYERYKIIKSI